MSRTPTLQGFTKTCPTCGHVTGPKESEAAAERSLEMHRRRAHVIKPSGSIQCPYCENTFKKITACRTHIYNHHPGQSASRAALNGHPGSATSVNQHAFTKVRKPRAAARASTAEIHIHYCPNCGLDLHAVAVGMAMNQR